MDTHWIFLDEAEVEPTNNREERFARRRAVGENAATAPKAKKATAGWNASSPSGKPAAFEQRPLSPAYPML